MAERIVFVTKKIAPYWDTVRVSFDWNAGQAASQKQKNIRAIHEAYIGRYPNRPILEISSKSMQPYGKELSAFNLKMFVKEKEAFIPVECVYQSAKTFQAGGPYLDLLEAKPKDAKRDERLKSSGVMKCFTFEGREYPLFPKNAFYDFIYINALIQNEELAGEVLQYEAFTDIEFSPNKGMNCQARAAAIFVGIAKAGRINEVKDFDSFVRIMSGN